MFGHASKSHYIRHISFYYVLSLSIFHSILHDAWWSGAFCPKYACRDLSGSNLFVYKNMAFDFGLLDPSCFWQNCLVTKDETHGGSRFVMFAAKFASSDLCSATIPDAFRQSHVPQKPECSIA